MTKQDSGARFDDDLDALAELLAAEGIDAPASQQIVRRDPSLPTPMSYSQELLWLLDRATHGLTAYNMPVARRLRGPLDLPALESALATLVARHEVLRTRFTDEGGGPQQVIDPPAPFHLTSVDATGATSDAKFADAQRIVRERARTPFDLTREHLFRATLVRLTADDHVLVLETHHIVMDGWSLGIVFRELAQAYASARAGRADGLPEPAIQYGDFAAWQRDRLSGPRLEELLAFWRTQLGDATDPLALPTDRKRTTSTGFAGARESITLSAAETAGLKRFAQERGATAYMLLLAAYATVLHRYTGRENVLIGSGSAGRATPETESLVGYVNNTLVQRADFAGDPTFAELLERVRRSALDAYDHQDVPLEKLVLELRKGDVQRGDAPLFDVVLTMQDTMQSAFSLDGLDVEGFGADLGATKFDITLLVSERGGELVVTSQYRSELFTPATMRRFLGHFRHVIHGGIAAPATRVSELPLLTDAEQKEITSWSATQVNEGTPATIASLFEAQAARLTSRAAIVAPSVATNTLTLTYAELNARANQLAHQLRSLGVGPDVPVGLLMDNTADALVALVGIVKSGGAYVPLSVEAPAARIAQQLRECGARAVVTIAALLERVPETTTTIALDRDDDVAALQAQPQTDPVLVTSPDDLAYVLFTSGSTGTPKGVAVTHANAVHYARAVSRVLADVPRGVEGDGFATLDGWQFGLASTLAADLGNTSLLVSLLAGGTLHVLGKQVTTEPERFASYMTANPLDVLKITPNHLAALVTGKTGTELGAILPRQWTIVGGEALRPDVARALLAASPGRLLNHYGPTETTVGVCTFEVTADSLAQAEALGTQTVPIGHPLANTRTYVVDTKGNEQPVSIPGELLLGGAGVARGYLGRVDLTRERFLMHRDDRVYRTGDRVRRLETGAIEFLGRADDQVKVRGFRVELAEIAHVLRAHAGVSDAVTILRPDHGGEPGIVAYVVPKSSGYAVSHGDRPTPETLTEWIAATLPAYMVPWAIVLLDALPLTPNGKVDTNALPAPETAGVTTQRVAPRTDTEKRVAAIWSEILRNDDIGVTDNFIALGGHSLMAIRVLGKISKSFGVRLTLRSLFEAPTVEQLATVLDAEVAKTAAAPAAGIGAVSRDAYRISKAPSPAGSDGTGGAGR